jgi:anti-sigma factor RsiW
VTDPVDAHDAHDFLSGYLDGELTGEERADVEARLGASADLRAELDEVRIARDMVRALPTREAPAGFWDAVTARVAAAPTEPAADAPLALVTSLESRRRRRVRTAWLAGAAAAVAAVVAVIVLPGRTQVRPNVKAVATQHAASSSDVGDSISSLATVSPLVGRR